MDDDDVVEIPPPPLTTIPRTPKPKKHKEVIVHDVIEIDNDEDSVPAMVIDERGDRRGKGKAIKDYFDGYHDQQAQEAMMSSLFDLSGSEIPESYVAANVGNLDGHMSDLSYDDDDFADLYLDEFMDVDQYALMQSHFDNVDIPPGIEAPIPWFMDPPNSKVNLLSGSSSVNQWGQMQPDAVGLQGNSSPLSPWPLGPDHFSKKLGDSSSSKDHIDSNAHPSLSSGWKLPKRSKKKQPALHHQGSAPNLPVGVESSKSQWLLGPFQRKKKLASSSSSTNYNSANQFGAVKKGSSTPYNPLGVQLPPTWWPGHFTKSNTMPSNSSLYNPLGSIYPPGQLVDIPWVGNVQAQNNVAGGGISTTPVKKLSSMEIDEILKNYRSFKQFDTIEDHSDHHYTNHGKSTKQPPKTWARRIQEEWKILEKDLPDTIFVRVYESRLDLLRAVIVGAEGTPYHDGLFFFDVSFPSGYPNVPPHVYYHSGGLRLNPNLYNCGKVCLSLLNTWSGNKNEKWIPGKSTMLQVLVSIQGLILNAKPYFNEPGYARDYGSVAGEKRSDDYNEKTFILSLRTMVYIMRRPPKHFNDFVLGHFNIRACDILVACKAYMDGAQVGCLVKGGVQDVDEGDKSCSQHFKNSLAGYVPMLVTEFTKIGANDCEKVLAPATVGNNMPQPATSMISC